MIDLLSKIYVDLNELVIRRVPHDKEILSTRIIKEHTKICEYCFNIKSSNKDKNYMLEFNITDYNLTKEFKLNNTRSNEHIYDIQNLNSIRSKLIDIYNTGIKKEESAKWYVAYIWEHLNNSGVLQRYKDKIASLTVNASSGR